MASVNAKENSLSSSLAVPNDPSQSIQYWKPHVIAAKEDVRVAKAQDIFQQLLGAWDLSRVEPDLFVVTSSSGPWAASLSDGNILLSLSAIETCFAQGESRGEHLLAFVLSHELAHQKGDDLWHQKFFRMAGTQSPELQASLLQGLSLDESKQLERVEAQADHDGVMIMASVGFDPQQIFQGKDFYTLWVESIWGNDCNAEQISACEQAHKRALRTQTQMHSVVNQSVLYELGIQALVAGRYDAARDYFLEFGKDYPSRIVHQAIAMSYLLPADALNDELAQLIDMEKTPKPKLYLPLFIESLDQEAALAGHTLLAGESSQHRGENGELIRRHQRTRNQWVEKAIVFLEKAVRLQPQMRISHLQLVNAYLLAGNPYMARGILQGKYIPEFGEDQSALLYLALIALLEGKVNQAQSQLVALKETLAQGVGKEEPIAPQILTFTVFQNLSSIYSSQGLQDQDKALWKDYAKKMQKAGSAIHFQLALQRLNVRIPDHAKKEAARLGRMRVGDKLPATLAEQGGTQIWMQGEPLHLINGRNNLLIVADENKKITQLWQNHQYGGEAVQVSNLQLSLGDPSDRPLKRLGIPSREIRLAAGRYIAYDDYGIGLKIKDERISGWFLY